MNTSQLVASVERMFCCIDGPGRAYFEIPFTFENQPVVERFVYTTINVAMVGESDVTEPALCSWMLARLNALITTEQREDMCVLLLWRQRPHVTEFTDEKGRICTSLRARLVIPGIDLSFAGGTNSVLWL